MTDEIYQHIDVREEGKTNAFSLGNSLWIGTEEFEDLDEIIARYRDAEGLLNIPMAPFYALLQHHPTRNYFFLQAHKPNGFTKPGHSWFQILSR